MLTEPISSLANPPAPRPVHLGSRHGWNLTHGHDGQRDLADYEQQARALCAACGHALDSAPGQAIAAGQGSLFCALLAHMDADGDQHISPDEFAAAAGRPVQDQSRFDAAVAETARSLIQAADHDRTGVLTPAAYARLTAAYGASPQQAGHAFTRLDLDGNGVLDTAELTQAITQFFTSPDPAAPGNLTFGRL